MKEAEWIDLSTAYQTPAEYNPPKIYVDLQKSTQYPNHNSIEYRQMPVSYHLEALPFIEHIAQNSSGTVVIGCNDYIGRLFYGNVFAFESIEDAVTSDFDHKNSVFRVQGYSPVTGLEFLNDTIVLIGEYNGGLHLYSTKSDLRTETNGGYCLFLVGSQNEHRGSLRCMEIMKSGRQHVVTGDSHGCLKLWDMASGDLTSMNTFRQAHNEIITGLSTSHDNAACFVTCSNDKSLLSWDTRLPRPAIALLENTDASLKCVNWMKPGLADNRIVVGDKAGKIFLVDPKIPKKVLCEAVVHSRPFHRIICNGSKIVTLTDSNTVKVFDIRDDKFVEIYQDSNGTDHLRSALWQSSTEFHVVGWQKQLRKHKIENS